MRKRFVFALLILLFVVILHTFVKAGYNFKKREAEENNAPVVKIIAPKNNTFYDWKTPIQYKIKVSDQEDGESAFDEIPSNEVFLQVKYVPNALKAAELTQQDKNEPAGLTAIKSSNCLNCHSFTGKLIGPSFYDISKHYPFSHANLDLLTKHVKEGSTGVWGNVPMPTHPELTKEETREIVQGILKNPAEQNVNYYRGTAGYFTIEAPVSEERKGLFVVTASYTDHGLKDKAKQNKRGRDVIIIQGK